MSSTLIEKFRSLFLDGLTDFQKELYHVTDLVSNGNCFFIRCDEIVTKSIMADLLILSTGQLFSDVSFYVFVPNGSNQPCIKVYIRSYE